MPYMQPSKAQSTGRVRTSACTAGCAQPLAPRGHSNATSMSLVRTRSFATTELRTRTMRME
eukprot:15637612-Heterocapsa_arctica.AAC.1